MRNFIDPGKKKPIVAMFNHIIYSKNRKSLLTGQDMNLELALITPGLPPQGMMEAVQKGMPIEGTILDKLEGRPTVMFIPGSGWRGGDKDLMVPEMVYLAEAGYIACVMYYRSSAEAKFPAQLIDVKAAIRWLKTTGRAYGVDPEHIAVMGRSAGGHLTAFSCMNLPGFDSEENPGVSSDVKCGVDLFGPTDLEYCMHRSIELSKQPGARWSNPEDSHECVLLDGVDFEKARAASPINYINEKMVPILILHGDSDPMVEPEPNSGVLYDRITESGYGKGTEFYMLKNAGHGTDEFWQVEIRNFILEFLKKHL